MSEWEKIHEILYGDHHSWLDKSLETTKTVKDIKFHLNETLMEKFKNSISEKEKLLEEYWALSSFLNPLNFSIWGSWVEVLLWNNDLKMSDIDIQILLENKEEEKKLTENLKKFKNAWYNIDRIHNAKYVVKKKETCYDLHILHKEWNFYVEHSNQWDFFFPEESYWIKDWITYLKPEILLLMSKWSKVANEKNKKRIQRLEKLSSTETVMSLSKKFKFVKR